jgi:hypothetical protein
MQEFAVSLEFSKSAARIFSGQRVILTIAYLQICDSGNCIVRSCLMPSNDLKPEADRLKQADNSESTLHWESETECNRRADSTSMTYL